MPKIINLATIHSLLPVHQGITAFTRLCDNYSPSTLSCCPSFFHHSTNYAWVMYRYYQALNALINPYKLGQLTTETFLNGLLAIFPFMAQPTLAIRHQDKQRLNANKDFLWSLHNVAQPSTLDYAKALLEEAWNSIICFTEEDTRKLQALFQENRNDIYFISNTNELNAFKIQQWLHLHFSDEISSYTDSISNILPGTVPLLKIGPGKYMALSYLCHVYKTDNDNRTAQVPSTTPSLLQAMLDHIFQGRLDDITLISQYPKDRTAAERLGIPSNNIHSAQEYFQQRAQEAVPLSRGNYTARA